MIRDLKNEWRCFCYDMDGVWSGERNIFTFIIKMFLSVWVVFFSAVGFFLAGIGWYRFLNLLEREEREKGKFPIPVRIHPETARTLLRQAGLQKKEIRDLPFRFESGNNSVGRKIELQTIVVMLKQFGFSDEEIKRFCAGENLN